MPSLPLLTVLLVGVPKSSPEEAVAPRGPYVGRALGVALVWLVGASSALLGTGCPIAHLTHHPCPGCGMTRALQALLAGELRVSLALQPLALVTLLMQLSLAAWSIYLTFAQGSPFDMWRGKVSNLRIGRAILLANVFVFALIFALWGLRELGLFGGPVPVV